MNNQRRASEILRIEAYKENWYALAVCMCTPKIKSRTEAFNLMGIKIDKEPSIIIAKKLEVDKSEVEALYKELGSIRKVALKLGCNQSTLYKFFRTQKIKTYDVRPKIADKYDKQAIMELINEGKKLTQIANIMGYEYPTLYKYVKANLA